VVREGLGAAGRSSGGEQARAAGRVQIGLAGIVVGGAEVLIENATPASLPLWSSIYHKREILRGSTVQCYV
jgi:hypothetical protein